MLPYKIICIRDGIEGLRNGVYIKTWTDHCLNWEDLGTWGYRHT